jgi:hypothetical protein
MPECCSPVRFMDHRGFGRERAIPDTFPGSGRCEGRLPFCPPARRQNHLGNMAWFRAPAWPDRFRSHRTDSDPPLPGHIHAMFSYGVDTNRRARKRFCTGNRIIAHMPGSRVDEAVTACMGWAQPDLAATPSVSNSRFLRELMQCRGCPTARLLRSWPRSTVSNRRR